MKHRPEIDGLRTIAVLPVIFYHAGVPAFKGGFVGVDIFFVISGYLISTILLEEVGAGNFSFTRFYARRARRILPALFVVMAACLPFAWLWLLPAEMERFARSLMAVCFSVSNFYFYANTGYFEPSNELVPLLHTWSLAVEEQYYLIFPVILVLTRRWRRSALMLMLVLAAIGSLALAQAWARSHLGFTFYLLPTRAWELLLGVFAAFWLRQGRAGLRVERRQGAAAWLGIAFIGIATFCYDKDLPYPSVYALLPTVGAVLVILFAGPGTSVASALSTRPMVGLGLISYSIYLWHQPILAFARHRSLAPLDVGFASALVLMSIPLAYLTWRFVENPFRSRTAISTRWALGWSCAGLAGLVAFGFLALQAPVGFGNRNAVFQEISQLETIKDSPCHTRQRRSAAQIDAGDACRLGAPGTPRFALIGDSHAGALSNQLSIAATRAGMAGFAVSGGYCPPLLNGFRLSRYQDKDCRELTDAAFRAALASPTVEVVILFAEWSNYTQGYRDDGYGSPERAALASDAQGGAARASQNAAVFERSLAATVETLTARGKAVVLVAPAPEFKSDVLPYVAKARLFGSPTGGAGPAISASSYASRNQLVFDAFDKQRQARVLPLQSLFCDASSCRSSSPDGEIWFSDTNHLTGPGARKPASELIALLTRTAASDGERHAAKP